MNVNSSIKPHLDFKEIKALLKQYYDINECDLHDLGSYVDQNILVNIGDMTKRVLKIHDGAESLPVIAMQIEMAKILAKDLPEVSFPENVPSINGKTVETYTDDTGQPFHVRMITFVEGSMLKDCEQISEQLLLNIGKTVAKTDVALKDYYVAAANRPDLPWDLKNTRQIAKLSHNITDAHKRRLVDFFFMKFENEVEDILFDTRKSVVHGDLHRYSMMVNKTASGISGIIDFGDSVYTHTICNLAVCLSDIMVVTDEPITAAAIVVKAYHQYNHLTEAEIEILHFLVCTRLAIYITMAAVSAKTQTENTHAQLKERQIYRLMQQLLQTNPVAVEDQYRKACGFISKIPQIIAKRSDTQALRSRFFSNMLYTHYDEPLHLHAGALQYLYDDVGNTYFDCVNNVSQWGHNNPHIVRPAQLQISRLNTNSRYVYDQMTQYAEKLLATFPDELDVVFFCNSGSEANDLAMRIAKTVTKNSEVIVIDTAYHGHTNSCTDISPNRIDRPGKPGLPAYVHSIPAPDVYRGKYTEKTNDIGEKYASEIDVVINKLANDSKAPAAFIAESLIGTGGQFVLPKNYLKTLYPKVRAAGGLCIADEVQVGFARTADHMWCFESQEVVPDIVTFGKPMGNGHPMAALVTKRSIADKFDNGVTFFNTFSANPVSCAFGNAVLDVLNNDDLQKNTKRQSTILFDGLNDLKEKFTCIGDVRGKGLYIGVELVESKETKKPSPILAKQVVEKLKERFILINTNGYDNNVIKIKPPLIIEEKDVQHLLLSLEAVLNEILTEKRYLQ